MSKNRHTRREFLRHSASSAIAGALYWSVPVDIFAGAKKGAKVVLIRDKNVLDARNKPSESIVQRMLDEAVTRLVGETDALRAWKRLVLPDDIVGIKSNEWSYLPTPPEVERAIKQRLIDAGVSEGNISINDRGVRDDPVFKQATALINVRPLRTHHWSGVGGTIKNYITFVKEPSSYHPDTCADLAAIWKQLSLRGKTCLNILVLFTPLFHGIGPHHFNPTYTWPYMGLIAGFDPVAVDATGVRILLAKRREFFGEERPLNPPPKHIFLADTRHQLGTADPRKIALIKIGWKEGALV